MTQKYKMTGCAKFIIFIIIAIPLSWIAASYYNGSNPFEKLKNIEIFNKTSTTNNSDAVNIDDYTDKEAYKKELELRDLEIKHLKQKIEKLEDLVETQKKQIDNDTPKNTKK